MNLLFLWTVDKRATVLTDKKRDADGEDVQGYFPQIRLNRMAICITVEWTSIFRWNALYSSFVSTRLPLYRNAFIHFLLILKLNPSRPHSFW